MKICPKVGCGKPHEKPGQFCSRACANSRTFSQETIKKKSEIAKKYYEDPSSRIKNSKGVKGYWEKVRSGKYLRNARIAAQFLEALEGKGFVTKQHFKEHLLKQGIKENKCEGTGCATGPLWLGGPIVCEVHHEDGNKRNQRRDNIKMLCPNCHSQTRYFRNRNCKIVPVT